MGRQELHKLGIVKCVFLTGKNRCGLIRDIYDLSSDQGNGHSKHILKRNKMSMSTALCSEEQGLSQGSLRTAVWGSELQALLGHMVTAMPQPRRHMAVCGVSEAMQSQVREYRFKIQPHTLQAELPGSQLDQKVSNALLMPFSALDHLTSH